MSDIVQIIVTFAIALIPFLLISARRQQRNTRSAQSQLNHQRADRQNMDGRQSDTLDQTQSEQDTRTHSILDSDDRDGDRPETFSRGMLTGRPAEELYDQGLSLEPNYPLDRLQQILDRQTRQNELQDNPDESISPAKHPMPSTTGGTIEDRRSPGIFSRQPPMKWDEHSRKKSRDLTTLLNNYTPIGRAIIFGEILGPPKAIHTDI